MSKFRGVDQSVFTLAESFLAPNATTPLKVELAQAIQTAIEVFLRNLPDEAKAK